MLHDLDLWFRLVGAEYLDDWWQAISGWALAEQALFEHYIHHPHLLMHHYSSILLWLFCGCQRSEISSPYLLHLHATSLCHSLCWWYPCLHLQGASQQHYSSRDDPWHKKLRSYRSPQPSNQSLGRDTNETVLLWFDDRASVKRMGNVEIQQDPQPFV